MIIHHELIQGTPLWRKTRAGICTASEFSSILTPKTMERSKSADAYENQCVAELIIGKPVESFGGTKAMERGKELEPDASMFYEMKFDVKLQHVGFVTNDAKTAGCSPDAVVIVDDKITQGCETKVPGPTAHVGYLLSSRGVKQEKGVIHIDPTKNYGGAYDDHKSQIQGNIWICETDHWDIMSYHPEIKEAIYRVHRDDAYLKLLAEQIAIFTDNVHRKLAIIRGDVEALGKVA